MANEDYQLEELENAAVNKSNNAKRIAAAAGILAAGGAAGYAATNIPLGNDDESKEILTEEDLESVTDTGANQVHEPEVTQQPVQQPQQPATPPTPPVEDEVELTFEKTTQYYDENQNLLVTTEEGTLEGHKFQLMDIDGDMRADVLAYDKDGNGIYNEDEVVELSGKDQITMGHATSQHDVKFVALNEPEPEPNPEPYIEPLDINEEKDYTDNEIHNDFEDEKTGENYQYDYAENNENYNNNGDIEQYSASSSDYAYEEEEEVKDESDYEYNDLAENDMTEDSLDDFGDDSLDII